MGKKMDVFFVHQTILMHHHLTQIVKDVKNIAFDLRCEKLSDYERFPKPKAKKSLVFLLNSYITAVVHNLHIMLSL